MCDNEQCKCMYILTGEGGYMFYVTYLGQGGCVTVQTDSKLGLGNCEHRLKLRFIYMEGTEAGTGGFTEETEVGL